MQILWRKRHVRKVWKETEGEWGGREREQVGNMIEKGNREEGKLEDIVVRGM